MRVGYFGPEGTFTQEALLAATAGLSLELIALPTIYDTVMAVHDRTVEPGLGHVHARIQPVRGVVNVPVKSTELPLQRGRVRRQVPSRIAQDHPLVRAHAPKLHRQSQAQPQSHHGRATGRQRDDARGARQIMHPQKHRGKAPERLALPPAREICPWQISHRVCLWQTRVNQT